MSISHVTAAHGPNCGNLWKIENDPQSFNKESKIIKLNDTLWWFDVIAQTVLKKKGKYLEDRVHIQTSNNIIIDTTYRQFLTDYRSCGKDIYSEYLFNELDPFFVGTKNEFDDMIKKCKEINKKCFSNLNPELNDLFDFWKKETEITYKMDLYDCWINNKKKMVYLFKKY